MKGFQPPYYQAVCFASKLSKVDFIAADAIAKLRQVRRWVYNEILHQLIIFVENYRKTHTQ